MAKQSAPAIPVLVTRPRAEAETFATVLSARFGARVRPVIAPLLVPRFLSPEIPAQTYVAVVFTSAQAVEATRHLSIDLPHDAWCVGSRTAAAATAGGFAAISAGGDADALIETILADRPDGRILYVRGVDTRGNLLERLREAGIFIDVAIVYAQDARPLSREAVSLLSRPYDLIVPLFSPRTAALFRAALPSGFPARLHLAAMSSAVAQSISDVPHAALLVADHPDSPAMLDAVETLLAGLPAP